MSTGGGGPCPDYEIDPDIAEIAPALLVEIPEVIDSDCDASHPVESYMGTSLSVPHASQAHTTVLGNSEESVICNEAWETTLINNEACETTQPSEQITEAPVEFSSNEKKIRVQILHKEHLSREKRAEALHNLQIQFLKEKHELEMKILEQNLREAQAKADTAQK